MTTEVATKQPIFKLSVDTQLVIDRLMKAQVGEVVTYADLSAILGRNIQYASRGCLTTACKRLQADHAIVFGTVRSVGVKRLNDSEKVAAGLSSIPKIRSQARNGAKRIVCAQYDALSKEDKVKHNTGLSFLGVMGEMTKPKIQLALAERVKEAQDKLPLQRTLEFFASGK